MIRFPQLTMPLLAAYTPEHRDVGHTDEIVERVDFNKKLDLVGITANTPAAPHAYSLAQEFRKRKVPVVIGGPHATLLPDEAMQHANAVVIGKGELVWPQVLADFERGELQRQYKACVLPDLKRMPAPSWDLIKGRTYGKGVTIATRGCPFACEYCTVPQMWASRQFYSMPSILERMGRSRAGLWWNVARNLGYHLALRNFGSVGFNPELAGLLSAPHRGRKSTVDS